MRAGGGLGICTGALIRETRDGQGTVGTLASKLELETAKWNYQSRGTEFEVLLGINRHVYSTKPTPDLLNDRYLKSQSFLEMISTLILRYK